VTPRTRCVIHALKLRSSTTLAWGHEDDDGRPGPISRPFAFLRASRTRGASVWPERSNEVRLFDFDRSLAMVPGERRRRTGSSPVRRSPRTNRGRGGPGGTSEGFSVTKIAVFSSRAAAWCSLRDPSAAHDLPVPAFEPRRGAFRQGERRAARFSPAPGGRMKGTDASRS
jgi:hypothetical protein